jgi:ribonucleoside-diphosphate reductase alpha chain
MGFAELLIRLRIPYDSDQAVQLGETLMKTISTEARMASIGLASERGTFPNWSQSVFKNQHVHLRNATCTAIAPTGTISIIAGTTPSIEPIFALVTERSHTLGGEPLYEMAPLLDQSHLEAPVRAPQSLNKEAQHDHCQPCVLLPEQMRRLYKTALEIPPERHLQMQAAFQRHVDNAVSKTINLPGDAKVQDVGQAYWRAWELGLKGVTVFRSGCKGRNVL